MFKNIKGFIAGFLISLVLMTSVFIYIEKDEPNVIDNTGENEVDVDNVVKELFAEVSIGYDSSYKTLDSINYNNVNYVSLENILETLKLDYTWDENSKEIVIEEEKEIKSISINREYDWYIDQGNTGKYSNDNCGPSTAVMAGKWYDEDFDKTVEDAREKYGTEGGWWYTSDITSFLGDYNIPNEIKRDVTTQKVIDELKEGNIVILCNDTTYLKERKNNERQIGKFYGYSGGHFLIVKGVKEIDDKTYFEVYDSNTWGKKYDNGEPMGKDRFYNANELIYSAVNWWDSYIVVYDK